MTGLQFQIWLLILAGPWLVLAPFALVALREAPELFGRRAESLTARACLVRPEPRWAVV